MLRTQSRPLHRKPSRERLVYAAIGMILPAILASIVVGSAAHASTGSVTGAVWDDVDRDGLPEAGEPAFAGKGLVLFDAGGRAIASAATDPSGRYTFADVAPGSYRVAFTSPDWSAMKDDWVPTTTGSLRFQRDISVSGPVTADFGLRRILRSTTAGAPLSSFTGPSGLVVESYNDAVSATQVHDALVRGMVGGEAQAVRVWFDLGDVSSTTITYGGSEGSFVGYSAKVKVDYLTWLQDPGFDATLAHEYGHAWSMYYALMVQQDSTLGGYLRARGLEGDSRVGSDVFWDPMEMIAEDYRQLFGSATALVRPQANSAIPPAADVTGLRDYLRDVFTQPPGASPSPTPSPTPAPDSLTVDSVSMNPAPVTKSGTASASLSTRATVSARIETTTGALVRTLVSDVPASTSITAPWDRRDDKGRRVSSGTYVLVVTATDGTVTTSATSRFAVK